MSVALQPTAIKSAVNLTTYGDSLHANPVALANSGPVPATDSRRDQPSRSWTHVPHDVIADCNLSDRAYRLWTALDRWCARDRWPTNTELALACGWRSSKTGAPATQRVTDALNELEGLGVVRRIPAADGRHRYGFEVVRPRDYQCSTPDTGHDRLKSSVTQVTNDLSLRSPMTCASSQKRPEHKSKMTCSSKSKEIQEEQARNSRERACELDESVQRPEDTAESSLAPGARSPEPHRATERPSAATARRPPATPVDDELEPFEAGAVAGSAADRAPTRREQMAAMLGGARPGDHEPDPDVLAVATALVDRWFGARADIHEQIRYCCRVYPSTWFVKALKRLVMKGRPERCGWGLVRTVLEDWIAAGAPDAGPEDGYDDELNRIPPSRRKAPATPGGRVERGQNGGTNQYGGRSPEAEATAKRLQESTIAQIRAQFAKEEEDSRREPARERAIPQKVINAANRLKTNVYIDIVGSVSRSSDERLILDHVETHPAVSTAFEAGGLDGLADRLISSREAIQADDELPKTETHTAGPDSIVAMVRGKRLEVARETN